MEHILTLVIDDETDGMLLRDLLKKRLGLSYGIISRLKFSDNGILVNGRHVTVRWRLSKGETLTLSFEGADKGSDITPEELPLEVLYEDREVILVNKPPNMPTHPSPKYPSGTLANALACYYAKQGQAFVFRAIHRLDKDTSGIVLVAKTPPAAYYLWEMSKRGEIEKDYVALVLGETAPEGEIDLPIGRLPPDEIRHGVIETGQSARTRYRKLEGNRFYSLLSCTLETGRTHQIRIHMQAIGHPVLGDPVYGGRSPLLPHQALHCRAIRFINPVTGTEIRVEAPFPPDFEQALLTCRENQV